MKRTALIALAVAFPLTANAGKIETLPRGKSTDFNGRACTMVVQLGSTAGGIDRMLAKRLKTKFASTRSIKRTTIRPWGREGELSFCVEAAGNKVSATNYVKNILRAYGKPRRGYVRISGGAR